jgi:ATP sulfurylase
LQKTRFINSLIKEKRYLIDYANLTEGLFFHQKKFIDLRVFYDFLKKPYFGIPILFPSGLKIFNYKKNNKIYSASEKSIKKIIYNSNKNYRPFINYLSFGNKFSTNLEPKKKFNNIIKKIHGFNKRSKTRIAFINNRYKKVCAFQTRNIPHFGHEKIINYLLLKYDHVVVNPIIGPKKKGDIKFFILEKVYKFLIKKKYNNKVSYIPFIGNMFYAGPREALHHVNLRYKLGFSAFVVGRDHAGSDNYYKPEAAFEIVQKNKNFLPIKVEKVEGAYYCAECKKVVIKNITCKHNLLADISGTDFRECIKKKKYFKYANYDMQKFIFKLKNIFET